MRCILVLGLLSTSGAFAEEAIDVGVSDYHACAIYDSGNVYCWGTMPSEYPEIPFVAEKVAALPSASSIGVGRMGACAIDRKGDLWCWGLNFQPSKEEETAIPVDVPSKIEGLPRAHQVSLGFSHTCAIAGLTRRVWCWGANACGEVGCGDLEPRFAPTKVPFILGAKSISTGVNNTCAVLHGGELSCWGSDNPTMPGSPFVYESPDPLVFDEKAIPALDSVANGRNFACGVRTNGQVTCWGSNIMGQLGTNDLRLGSTMGGIGEVDGINRAEDLDAGYFSSCAVQHGNVHCWGSMDPSDMLDEPELVSVYQFEQATKVDVGDLFSCAIDDGRVYCWGADKINGIDIIPGMTMSAAAPVPGLPGEKSGGDLQRRLLVSYDEIQFLIEDGDFSLALDLIARLRAQGEDVAELALLEAEAHFELGFAARETNDLEAAYQHYSEAIRLSDGSDAAAFNNRALINSRWGNADAALEDIRNALEIRPDSSLFLANLCMFLRLDGELEAARDACEAAVEGGLPDNQESAAWVLVQRGLMRRMAGNLEGAVIDFTASVAKAEPATIERIQDMMKGASLYSGPADGKMNAELQEAIALCIRNDACFEQASTQMSDILESY